MAIMNTDLSGMYKQQNDKKMTDAVRQNTLETKSYLTRMWTVTSAL